MMSTLGNLRAHAPDANGGRITGFGQPACVVWPGLTLKYSLVAVRSGLRWPPLAAEARAPLSLLARVQSRLMPSRFSMIAAGMRAIERKWRERRTMAALECLSDAILEDIGIHRSEISFVTRARASGKWWA